MWRWIVVESAKIRGALILQEVVVACMEVLSRHSISGNKKTATLLQEIDPQFLSRSAHSRQKGTLA
jgi:hypothetical protein